MLDILSRIWNLFVSVKRKVLLMQVWKSWRAFVLLWLMCVCVTQCEEPYLPWAQWKADLCLGKVCKDSVKCFFKSKLTEKMVFFRKRRFQVSFQSVCRSRPTLNWELWDDGGAEEQEVLMDWTCTRNHSRKHLKNLELKPDKSRFLCRKQQHLFGSDCMFPMLEQKHQIISNYSQ